MTRPLALTLGEPAGIGPDITLAAWQRRAELALPPFYLLAPPDFIERRARRLGLAIPLRVVEPERALDVFATALPVVALAGLNPHAGEEGALGDEDGSIVAPAVEQLRADDIDARGPLPADTMFHGAARRSYDAALAMYHDQALIPIKTLAFDHAVNVTLGLPFVRTSPDHGTAFDIAGTGRADPTSLIAALQLAARLSSRAHSPPIARRA